MFNSILQYLKPTQQQNATPPKDKGEKHPTEIMSGSSKKSATDTSSSFTRTRKHHRDPLCKLDIVKELQNDALKPVGGSRVLMNNDQLMQVAHYYAPVRNLEELETLPSRLGKEEFGFSPFFMTPFVDATAQLGLFPMALNLWRDCYVFAPKCHVERSFTYISKRKVTNAVSQAAAAGTVVSGVDETATQAQLPTSPTSAGGGEQSKEVVFDFSKLGLSRKLLKKLEIRVHFVVRQGEQSMTDLHQSLAMIRRQHSENWLCAPLRSCVQHMMMTPQSNATSFYVLVVSEKRSTAAGSGSDNASTPTAPSNNSNNDILACDMGYLVGDIMTAFTGAYEVDGTGSVTLGASAKLLQLLGIPIWDLGMQMEYKQQMLGATTKKRKQWLQTVKQHKDLYAKEVEGVRGGYEEDGTLDSVEWLHRPDRANDSTNAKCAALLLKDPRKQTLLKVLAAGVDADLFMSADSTDDLIAKLSKQQQTTKETLTASPLSEGVAHVAINAEADDNTTTASKSQLKKVAKAAANAAKKEAKKNKTLNGDTQAASPTAPGA